MKLMIAGSRNITSFDISPYIPKNVNLIISGGARGIDTIAEEYADKHKISKLIIRPRYDLYGKCAPLIRNDIMVNMCDKVLAFWDGKSGGTKHTIEYAKNKEKEIEIIIIR